MNCIIIHGSPSIAEKDLGPEQITYDKHWMPWLRRALTAKGVAVQTPLMPAPWLPDYQAYKAVFDQLRVDEDTVLVGHSSGCAFLVRWLGETQRRVRKLILVAPWIIPGHEREKEFYVFPIDSGIKKRVGSIVVFTSNTEASDGKKSAEVFHRALGGKIILLENRGHFILRHMGTDEFPELLQEILE